MDLTYIDPNFVPVYSLDGIDAVIVAVCPPKRPSFLAVELLNASIGFSSDGHLGFSSRFLFLNRVFFIVCLTMYVI